MAAIAALLKTGCGELPLESIVGNPVGWDEVKTPIVGGVANGTNATVALYDGTALGLNAQVYCSGTLIAPRVVLTAGHCVAGPGAYVFFGSSPSQGGVYVPVSGVRRHNVADIGVVLLAERAPEYVEIAELNRVPIGANTTLRAEGFGVVDHDLSNTRGLRRMTSVAASNYDASSIVFAGGVCLGDSGGPAYVSNSTFEDPRVVAVHAIAADDCEPGNYAPSYSTRVDPFAEWVEDQIETYAPWDDDLQNLDMVRRRDPVSQLTYYEPAVDVDNDGRSDFCYRQASGYDCRAFDSAFNLRSIAGPLLSDVNGFDHYRYYSTIRLADMDGDGDTDVCFRDSTGFFCYRSNGPGLSFQTSATGSVPLSDANGFGRHRYYSTIRMGDVNGDLKDDVCVRQASGMDCFLSTGSGFSASTVPGPTAWSDANGFDRHEHYSTIRLADINGDGRADLCAREDAGIRCYISNGTSFPTATAPVFASDAQGYSLRKHYSTLQFADVTGDNKDDACIRSSSAYVCLPSTGSGFSVPSAISKSDLSDAAGYGEHKYYSTIRLAQINGADRRADLCVRSASAVACFSSSGTAFGAGVTGPGWSDGTGFGLHEYYSTMQFGDVDGDGRSDATIRDSVRVVVQLASPTDSLNFPVSKNGPALSGFSAEKYYRTIRVGATR